MRRRFERWLADGAFAPVHGATDNLPPADYERRWWEQAEREVA
jgi:transposase InsO family protein